MLESLLTDSQKKKISLLVKAENYRGAIDVLQKISTKHAGTAKTKDKRFVITEIVKDIIHKSKDFLPKKRSLMFYTSGSGIISLKSDNAKEIGAAIIWRAFSHKQKAVERILLRIADDGNWEVREYAAGAFASAAAEFPEFYNTLIKWRTHKSENVRRAVVMSAWGMRNRKDKQSPKKAFSLLEPLLYEASRYVKVNLGPFVIGTGYGNAFPKETLAQLKKWMKIKDENVRWNVAMAFNNSFGNRYPEEALKFIEVLLNDANKSVQRAAISTLRTLRKRHGKIVDEFLSKERIAL